MYTYFLSVHRVFISVHKLFISSFVYFINVLCHVIGIFINNQRVMGLLSFGGSSKSKLVLKWVYFLCMRMVAVLIFNKVTY